MAKIKSNLKKAVKQPHPHHVPLTMALMIAIVFILTASLLFIWNLFPHELAYVPPQNASSTIPSVPTPPITPPATTTPPVVVTPPVQDCGTHGHWNGTACLCGGIAGWSCPSTQVCGDMKPSPTTPDAMGTCREKIDTSSTSSLPLGLTPTTSSTEGRAVKIFLLKGYYSEEFKPAYCGEGEFFTVHVPATKTPIQASVNALLHWIDLIDGEGFTSNIPDGTQLLSATLSGGVLKLRFSSELGNYGGGSCNVESIRTQIEKTAKQFGNVTKVEISVPGKTAAETLQP
jgi:hypothetical protein